MVTGIGIDMIEVERVAARISKSKDFQLLVFSKKEIAYCEKKTGKYQHYAARFAAKEAFLKALGTGWKSGTAFNEIEIINNKEGKPEIFFFGKTAAAVAAMKISKISVSLSHLKTVASAVVIIEN
jgi:holo-[acyl-carrier protein] synthase